MNVYAVCEFWVDQSYDPEPLDEFPCVVKCCLF